VICSPGWAPVDKDLEHALVAGKIGHIVAESGRSDGEGGGGGGGAGPTSE
jgi:hypothetical protein